MGIIYVEGRYVSSSNLSLVNKKNELQDDRILKLEAILDDSDGSVENPEVLNSLILNNTKNIITNTEDIQSLKVKLNDNENQLLILTGSGEGSVLKQIDNAINLFALQITNNGTIDTFKEVLDYVVNEDNKIENLVLQLEELESNLKTTEENLLLKIEENNIVIFNEVDTRIETAFSWEDVN